MKNEKQPLIYKIKIKNKKKIKEKADLRFDSMAEKIS
jgi:hypothetical protein